jgi:hypothetical protein
MEWLGETFTINHNPSDKSQINFAGAAPPSHHQKVDFHALHLRGWFSPGPSRAGSLKRIMANHFTLEDVIKKSRVALCLGNPAISSP